MLYLKKNHILNHIEFYVLLGLCFLSLFFKYTNILIILIYIIIFLLYFHRNPDIILLNNPIENIIYSPAQGKILDIKIYNNKIKISIFLSIFDNHTQYIPIECIKIYEQFSHGLFRFAQQLENSDYNQRLIHVFKTRFGAMHIIQYSGYFARRIYSLSKDKQKIYKIGDKLGYIRFGSRVDIIFFNKKITQIFVKKGEYINALSPLIECM